jgi:hypothetical protein
MPVLQPARSMETIMTKEIKVGLGKKKKQKKAGDKQCKPGSHRREHHPGNKESGSNNTRLQVALLCASVGLPVVPLHGVKGGLCTCGNDQCEQPGRHPRTKRAATERALIKNTGPSGPRPKSGSCWERRRASWRLWLKDPPERKR